MALHETRAVATYLRDGSLWVGYFIDSRGALDFGDDRFDAAHGLALVDAEATSSTSKTGSIERSTSQTAESKTRSTLRPGAMPADRGSIPVSTPRYPGRRRTRRQGIGKMLPSLA